MSGALFARIKNWGSTDSLTAADLNAEFDNILTNFKPQMMDAYSANVTQMQVQTNPGAVGTESLPTSLAGEVERLRFQLAAITGNTYWYSAPAASLATLNTALGANTQANSITSGRMLSTSSQPAYIVPNGSAASISIKGTTTPLVYKIAGTSYTLAADLTVSSLTAAPSTNNTMVIDDPSLSGQGFSKLIGENGSTIKVASMGSSISALVGQIAAFKTASAEYVLCRVQSTTQLSQVFRGYFFQSNDTLFSRAAVSNGDTWTLVKLTWIYLTTAGAATVVYTNPSVGGTAPTSPATGDYWFDTANNIWKVYNSTTFVAANATLIGTCIQNTTATIGARSGDFFKAYSDLNTAEIITESTTQVRTRNPSARVSVYGTALSFPSSQVTWNSGSNMDSGQTFSASTYYYMYIKENGDPVISDIAPFDRRADLGGYYHPLNTWRCVGYSFANGSTQFNTTNSDTESFFRIDDSRNVTKLTAAVTSYPLPYIVPIRQEAYQCDASGGAFTQVLPPFSQWKGKRLIYMKTDSSTNAVTLQSFGTLTLSTTGNTTQGGTSLSSLASTAGLATGITYLVSGRGIAPGTTAAWVSGSSVTLSIAAQRTVTGLAVTFANPSTSSLNGIFTTLLHTQYEQVEIYSDGVSGYIMSRSIPSIWVNNGASTWTGSTTAPTKGTISFDRVWSRRVGANLELRYDLLGTGAGSNGSGDYSVAIPTYTAETDTLSANATVYGSGGVTGGLSVVGGGHIYANGINSFSVQAYVGTSSTLKVVIPGSGVFSSGVVGFSPSTLAISLTCSVPILNWNG